MNRVLTAPRVRRLPAPIFAAPIALLALGVPAASAGEAVRAGGDRPGASKPAGEVELQLLGYVRPRHARAIAASNWSVGAETMDRDFTIYRNWKAYLGPLGVKRARIQSGWARTERAKGVYDWAWLDEIVHDMFDQGVRPWVCLSYGNPLYGGDAKLHSALPAGEEALAAWDRFVRALVERYGKDVDEWEVWNEPALTDAYIDFFTRTAQAVRAAQPKAKILGLALGGLKTQGGAKQIPAFLEALAKRDKLHLVDGVTYHGYALNPDALSIAEARAAAAKIAPHVTLFQGEAGAPSERSIMMLGKHDWTETAQAKWVLRRLLCDLHEGIPSSYFSIIDMRYPNAFNRKGLLWANDDLTVHHAKESYRAVQHLTAVFDAGLKPVADVRHTSSAARRCALHAYRRDAAGVIVVIWFNDKAPAAENETIPVTLTLTGVDFREPVYVDLRTGQVFAVPAHRWSKDAKGLTFADLPVYDSPMLIAERAALPSLELTGAATQEGQRP
jgi:hypothetical protein